MKKRFTHVCKNALNKTFQSKIEFEDAENLWTNCRLRPPCAKDKLKREKERKENPQTVGNLLSHVLVVVMHMQFYVLFIQGPFYFMSFHGTGLSKFSRSPTHCFATVELWNPSS